MSALEYRRCANIRSRAHSDVQCSSPATYGDFCGRHHKKPIRFFDRRGDAQRNIYTRSHTLAVTKLQTWWRIEGKLKQRKFQGPAIYCRELAHNTTEVYSMDTIESIPQVFFFSFQDTHKLIWAFDIRSLLQVMSQGQPLQNPYTRDPIPQKAIQQFRARVDWLRKRKYALLYGLEETITPEQEWNQKVLDTFMKIEALGYLLSTSWFQDLSLDNLQKFYRALYQLWYWRLGLSSQEKEEICPGHQQHTTRLFKHDPDEMIRIHKDAKWWRRNLLGIMQSLVTRGTSKSLRGLGALYIVMGLVQVNEQAAEAYPWILESLGLDD
jgi:hypothetical protein